MVGLFLELLLIRWISTEIRIFAYLQNTVLVVCFLGLGMGCWDCRQAFALRDMLVPLGDPGRAARDSRRRGPRSARSARCSAGSATSSSGIRQLGRKRGSDYAAAAARVGPDARADGSPVGHLRAGRPACSGRLMNDHPNTIWAYSVNVARQPGRHLAVRRGQRLLPAAGRVVRGRSRSARLRSPGPADVEASRFALLAAIVGAGVRWRGTSRASETTWTPYQKLSLREQTGSHRDTDRWKKVGYSASAASSCRSRGTRIIGVNNTGYQATIDLRPETVARATRSCSAPTQRGYSQYDIPMKLHPNPEARAGRRGRQRQRRGGAAARTAPKRVVAVEIDPGIIEIGKRTPPGEAVRRSALRRRQRRRPQLLRDVRPRSST